MTRKLYRCIVTVGKDRVYSRDGGRDMPRYCEAPGYVDYLCREHYELAELAGRRRARVGYVAASGFRTLLLDQEGSYSTKALLEAFADGLTNEISESYERMNGRPE